MQLYLSVLILVNYFIRYGRSEDELVAVTALIRHGARIPESFYPTDPYKNVAFPYVLGDLTNHGIRQMYDVGKWLRERYTSFLSLEYDPNEIYAQSLNYDRCIMTGEATHAGLYPPISNEVWNKHLLWQPIPIHITPRAQDVVVNMAACPVISASEALIQTTPLYHEIMAKNQEFFNFISEKANETINLATLYPLFDTLFSELKLKLPIPLWAQEIYHHFVPLVIEYTKLYLMVKPERQILLGPMLHRIIDQFDRAIAGEDFGTTKTIYRKFMSYYATEWLLYGLTYSLGLPSINIPDFGALYLIELRKNQQGKYYVNILYRHSAAPGTKAVPAPIKGAPFNLDYGLFKAYAEKYAVNLPQWVSICEKFTNRTVNVTLNVPMS